MLLCFSLKLREKLQAGVAEIIHSHFTGPGFYIRSLYMHALLVRYKELFRKERLL